MSQTSGVSDFNAASKNLGSIFKSPEMQVLEKAVVDLGAEYQLLLKQDINVLEKEQINLAQNLKELESRFKLCNVQSQAAVTNRNYKSLDNEIKKTASSLNCVNSLYDDVSKSIDELEALALSRLAPSASLSCDPSPAPLVTQVEFEQTSQGLGLPATSQKPNFVRSRGQSMRSLKSLLELHTIHENDSSIRK